ncbi:MAG: hypothetical protein JSR58_05190 [Verrucomicrobia bacterium]|nr:hypothetical protein [Verrucomicrobiota bacterium]
MWDELERIFNRAFQYSFSWKKWLFVFPVLALCGTLAVLCHTLAMGANQWVGVTLVFLPTFICAGILLAAGVPLIRLYHDEVKGNPLRHRVTIQHSWKLMRGLASLSLPLILAYLVLWGVFGIFHLLRAIPNIGGFLGGLLSFGPFLLIAGSFCLSLIALLFLFFLTPLVALKSTVHPKMAEEFFARLKAGPFSHIFFLAIGLVPLLFMSTFLTVSAALTGLTYFAPERTWAVALQWFCIMIPFAALLSPAVIFFFNFAGESFVWMQRKVK